jgi:hypothetical protein
VPARAAPDIDESAGCADPETIEIDGQHCPVTTAA